MVIVSSGSGERPLLREDDTFEGIGEGTTWGDTFKRAGDRWAEAIEKLTSEFNKLQDERRLIKEIDNQPVIEPNVKNMKSKNKLCDLVKSRSVTVVDDSEDSELKEEFKKFSFEFNGKTKSKEDKLPKKLRNGW